MLWQPDGTTRQFIATAHVGDLGTGPGRDGAAVRRAPMTLDLYGPTSLVHACYYGGQPIFLADAAHHPQASPLIAEVLGEASGCGSPSPTATAGSPVSSSPCGPTGWRACPPRRRRCSPRSPPRPRTPSTAPTSSTSSPGPPSTTR